MYLIINASARTTPKYMYQYPVRLSENANSAPVRPFISFSVRSSLKVGMMNVNIAITIITHSTARIIGYIIAPLILLFSLFCLS